MRYHFILSGILLNLLMIQPVLGMDDSDVSDLDPTNPLDSISAEGLDDSKTGDAGLDAILGGDDGADAASTIATSGKKKPSTKKSSTLKPASQELVDSALGKFPADQQQIVKQSIDAKLLKKVTSLKRVTVDSLAILFQSAVKVGDDFASLYALVVKNLNPQGLDDRAMLINYLHDFPSEERDDFLKKVKASKLMKSKYDALTKKAILELVKNLDLKELAKYHVFFKALKTEGFFKKFKSRDVVHLYQVFSDIGKNYESLFKKAQQLKLIKKNMTVLEVTLILRGVKKIKEKDLQSILTNLSQQLILRPEADADDIASILEELSAVPVIAVEVYASRSRAAKIIGTGAEEVALSKLIRLERDSLVYRGTSSIPFLAQIVRLKNKKWSDQDIYESYVALKKLNILTPEALKPLVDLSDQYFKNDQRSASDAVTILSTILKIPAQQRDSVLAFAKNSLDSSGNLNSTDNILDYIKDAVRKNKPATKAYRAKKMRSPSADLPSASIGG